MAKLKESELILNSDGSIYHLRLHPGEIANHIISVGDPNRAGLVASYFDQIEVEQSNREFRTITGRIGSRRLTVISTGIGTDNIDIVFNELDALVNIDFKNRLIKKDFAQLNFYRIGTSGCLQSTIPIDSFLISDYAIGLDALGLFYAKDSSPLLNRFNDFLTEKGMRAFANYVAASAVSKDKSIDGFQRGITLTAPGFYAPQGRSLRLKSDFSKLIDILGDFELGGLKITNLEMETAGIYLLAEKMGHQAVSLNALLANRPNGQFSSTPDETIKQLVEKALELILADRFFD